MDMSPAFDAPVFSALDTEEFTPPGSPRTYMLGVLNYRQRAAFTRDMRRSCGDRPDRAVMLAVLRECLRELAPANLEDALATVEEAEAAPEDAGAQARLGVLERAVLEMPAYAALVEARMRYHEELPWISARHALRGWSGPGLPPFGQFGGLVPDALLDAIPAPELSAIGARADVLIWLGRSAEGNSAAPSPSPATLMDTPAG